jgi:four helix bundle protein
LICEIQDRKSKLDIRQSYLKYTRMSTSRSALLEERLVSFAAGVISVVESLPATVAGRHVANQLVRSGTSPAPNYAEARSAESRKDFVHKLKIALKELRETHVWLRIIAKKELCRPSDFEDTLRECDELIAVFVASTRTLSGEEKTAEARMSSPDA